MLKILHLEDNPLDAEYVSELLRLEGLEAECHRVETLAALTERLDSTAYDLVLSDFTLPGVDPVAALTLVRQRRPEIPFVFLSGTVEEEKAIDMLKRGANDYVLKQRMGRLVPAVRRALRESEDQARRRRAESALRESECRLQAIISSAMDAVIAIDSSQRIVLFNPAAVSIFQVSEKEALGQHINRFIPDRFREMHVRHVQNFGHSGTTRRRMGLLGAITGLRANGEEFPIEASISQTEVSGQKLYTVILRDITERERAEKALNETETNFRTLADNMSQLAWMADEHGAVFWFNKRWFEYTGTTLPEVQGWGWQKVHHPDHLDRVTAKMKQCFQTAAFWEDTFPLRAQDGSYRWFLSRATPIRNDAGQVIRWFGTNTDITEQLQAEAALRDVRDKLEQTVTDRTAQLLEANSSLQNFAYSVAHDLRSPLRSISSFTTLVLEECAAELGAEGRSMLERVVASATQMDRLLADLLEYSRMNQGEVKLERVPLASAVRDALRLLEQDIRTKRAQISIDPSMPAVLGHPATVVLILTNLISNALKFVDPGVQPQIQIRAEHPPGSPKVRLWVEDNGIGVSPADQKKLFAAFQRLHGKQTYPGTGLGLAIVRKGAERMGGHVGVVSEPRVGSRFWVELHSAES